jgi:hypothetical protein
MNRKTLFVAAWLLITLELVCSTGAARYCLPRATPLLRAAVAAGGQVLAFAGMATLALLHSAKRVPDSVGHDLATPHP